jgi:N-acetylglucosamine-6-sulfatase
MPKIPHNKVSFQYLVLFTFLVLSVPISLFLALQEQDIRQRAATPDKMNAMFWYEDSNLASAGNIPPDFEQMFTTKKDEWKNTRASIDVYLLRMTAIKKQTAIITDEFLKDSFLPTLKEDDIKLALEGGIASCVITDDLIDKELAVIARIHDLGGKVSYFGIQSVLSKPRDECDDPSQNERVENIDKRIQGVVKFTKQLKQRFPEIKVGIIDALPAKELEYKSWYTKLKQQLGQQDLSLDFIHQDMPVTEPLDKWVKKALTAERFVKNTLNVRTGLIITSATGGRTSDKAFHDKLLAGYKKYKGSGGSTDDIIIMSWFPHPRKSLPENAENEYPYTKTALTLAKAAGFVDTDTASVSPSQSVTPSTSVPTGDKPNVIVIMTDDQRWDLMETLPTIRQRLGGKGVTFTNAFASTPLCCPSRASFLTGLYTRNTNIWTKESKKIKSDRLGEQNKETIAVWLNKAGYRTALIGKYLNGYSVPTYVPPGWDKWFAFSNGQPYYEAEISDNGNRRTFGRKAQDYAPDLFKDEAVEFIKQTKGPFFLVFSPNTPHGSGGEDEDGRDNPKGLDGPDIAPRHKNNCRNFSNFKRPDSFNERDLSDKPKWVKTLPLVSPNAVEKFREEQLCSLKAVDEAFSQMVKALGNRVDNTVFIFYSDNGFSFGEHRHVTKNCIYESCTRVPMIISYPKVTKSKMESTELVTNVDLAPTIADLTGITIPVKVDGMSLVPLLKDPKLNLRDDFLLEVRYPKDDLEITAVRTDTHKYSELSSGEKELYDLKKDPDEMENVADKKEYNEVQTTLAKRLDDLRKGITPTPKPSSSISPSPKPSTEPAASITVSVLLHGIGSAGDNANPKEATLSNKNPKSQTRDVLIEFISAANKPKEVKGKLSYNKTKGLYTGTIANPNLSGPYTVKITVNGYLRKEVQGIVTLNPNKPTSLPTLSLTTGDMNSDNELNILDYNMILTCYEDSPKNTCKNKKNGDTNDDASVNKTDLNLWLREITQQVGD